MKKKTGKEIVPRRLKRRFPPHLCHTKCPVCGEGIGDIIELHKVPSLLGIPAKKVKEMIDRDEIYVGCLRKGLRAKCLLDLSSLKRIPDKVHATMYHCGHGHSNA